MKNSNYNLKKILPILFGFFIVGFVDLVGTATNNIKHDFNLSDSMASTLPMVVFLWFLIFSIPVGLLMNRIGRKKTVLLSMIVHLIAFLLPLFAYNFTIILITFALLGIGNTIIQVSLNPLLSNVVQNNKLTASLSAGQFVKAISSFLGPIIAAYAAKEFGDWTLIFPVYLIATLASSFWLLVTPITENQTIHSSSFKSSLSLLKNLTVLKLFIGIFTVVGIDVGINTIAPKLMEERIFGMTSLDSVYAISVYFIFRTIGSFLGSIMLSYVSVRKFYITSTFIAISSLLALIFADNLNILYLFIALVGLSVSNIFSIVFSYALQYLPDKSNDISALLIMGISGGALFPWLMGLASDSLDLQAGALIVLILCCVYHIYLSFFVKKVEIETVDK